MDKHIIALGFFDGVHLGHQAILRQAALQAGQAGLKSAAITFARHPRSLVRGRAPGLITTVARRERLMLEQGIDRVFTLTFDEQTADTAPEDFVRLLIQRYGAAGVVCGESFRFGKDAAGTPQLLRDMGLEVTLCPKVRDEAGNTISSTAVRALVREGDMARAAAYLGRPFGLEGTVVHGQQVGRRLGFPTLNLLPGEDMVLPRRGVYAGRVDIRDGGQHRALTNVGSRPTFSSADIISIESHIPGFSGDIYGREIRVELLRFLRPERPFESAEALRTQIEQDLAQALTESI